ncbi:MAG TPA: hypothetical protein VEO01_34475, partial [Pseudonocardiaceae bacterium]|nr:hypothetical protein [Pseudonocardiaceae bacterium]
DRSAPAREVGSVLGLDAVRAELSPADKVAAVRAEQRTAVTVMVGDGVNDTGYLTVAPDQFYFGMMATSLWTICRNIPGR